MAAVEVRFYASLRKYHPNKGSSEALSIELDVKTNLENLLDKLKIPKEEIAVLMVNGNRTEKSYILKDRDRIGLFPLIGGG